MTKKAIIFISVLTLLFSSVRADEGMWLLSLLNKNYNEMKAKGFKLTPEDIYSVNKACLKDAIVGLGNARNPHRFFCTGEIISSQGLVLTNHHCGYGYIQSHSSEQNDYLKNGFWAMTKEAELPNDGLAMSVLVRMDDVTGKALEGVTDEMSADDRAKKIRENSKAIETEAIKDTHYGARVSTMFEGNQYFLFVYETFLDVRLVGTPPESIGKFGGDTDNWMWPRHTGDFSMFRIYSDADGKPAKYSKDNIPYKPRHHLPVSIKGVEKGDFTMVMGFPGSTERYITSYGIEEALDVNNPSVVKIRTKKLEMMKQDMAKSDKIRIQYSSKHARTANYWKYFIGQSKGLRRLGVPDKKRDLEKQFEEWVSKDEKRTAKYGEVLTVIEKYYKENKEKHFAQTYMNEAIYQGGEIVTFAMSALPLYRALTEPNEKTGTPADQAAALSSRVDAMFKDFNLETDKKIFYELFMLYRDDVPQLYQLDIYSYIDKKYKGDLKKFTDDLYVKSIFADPVKLKNFLAKPSSKILDSDLAFMIVKSVQKQHTAIFVGNNPEFEKSTRLYMAGLLEMMNEKNFYPDANSTIRLTYGSVGDYEPADAVYYDFYTTIEGIIEKENPDNYEFIVPARLKELYAKTDSGKYGQNGDLRVCFTSNNDITGGNSGSPVINGNGELVGLAFDGNWEAMSGDIAFEPNLQKCINVDIRYVLWVIDKLCGAEHLVKEMTLAE